ncbi:MAG: hypothetical protein R3D70_14175 [Rhizobiaceae bacterium]
MAKRAIGLEDAATTSRKQIGTLKLMEKAVNDPGFYSGTGAGAVANLKRMATSLNIPGADGIDSVESFNALSAGRARCDGQVARRRLLECGSKLR